MKTIIIHQPSIDPDYLLRSALERIRQLETEISKLKQAEAGVEKYICIPQGSRVIRLPLREICYVKAESNYSRIRLLNGQEYITSKTLKSWVDELSGIDFIRYHRSFFVNPAEVAEVDLHAHHLVLRNGEHIPVSRKHQKDCLRFFRKGHRQGRQETIHKLTCTVHKLKTVAGCAVR